MGTTKTHSLHHFSCIPFFLSPFRFASHPLLDEDLNKKPPLLRGGSDFKRGGPERVRTAVEAFAELCLATRPQDLFDI